MAEDEILHTIMPIKLSELVSLVRYMQGNYDTPHDMTSPGVPCHLGSVPGARIQMKQQLAPGQHHRDGKLMMLPDGG